MGATLGDFISSSIEMMLNNAFLYHCNIPLASQYNFGRGSFDPMTPPLDTCNVDKYQKDMIDFVTWTKIGQNSTQSLVLA